MNCCKILSRICARRTRRHQNIAQHLHVSAKRCLGDAVEAISPSRMCVEEAQSVMGYSPPFFKRWLETEEIDDIAYYLQKLAGTQHPLINIAKNSLFKNETPTWGLIILLLSSAGGIKKTYQSSELDIVLGILNKQRILAEVTELLRTSILIHKGIHTNDETIDDTELLKYGNKISLLSGDFLFSKVFHDLAHMKNAQVFSIVATALRDLSEGEFLSPLPGAPKTLPDSDLFDEDNINHGPYNVDKILGNYREEWIMRNLLGSANLLGKSCQGSLLLAGHDERVQEQGYLFGKHLALAWQANLDCQAFEKDVLDCTGLPVMLHLKSNHHLYEAVLEGRYEHVRKEVQQGTALDEARELQMVYACRAFNNLQCFDYSKATESLQKLLLLFKDN